MTFHLKNDRAYQAAKDSRSLDLESFLLAHSMPEQSQTPRFLTVSAALHAAAFIAIALMSIPLVEQAKTETITIEIQDNPSSRMPSQGVLTLPSQGGPVAQPKAASTKTTSKKTAKLTKAASKHKATKGVAKHKPTANSYKAHSKQVVAPKTTFKAVPLSIDDIEAPELDTGALARANHAPSSVNQDFDEDFSNIDKAYNSGLKQEQDQLDKLASDLASDQDSQLAALDENTQNEANRLSEAQNALHERNSQAIASARASERAAGLAAAAAARAQARSRALRGAGGTKSGAGSGNSGRNYPNNRLAGLPNGIRSLDQLRQMPGNPRPQYAREERLRGDQGTVAFIAYITKDGYPQKFRMIDSTGYRNLDLKTLTALKKWRFYPGQEGWVELPFRWDLRGGAVEDGGLLRRNISRR